MEIPVIEKGQLPPCPVAADALQGIPRQQTNAGLWHGENWRSFVGELQAAGIEVREDRGSRGIYVTDAGGLAHGLPHGVMLAQDAQQVAMLMMKAQHYRIPVTTRGGGLTTEGEAVAYGGMLLDMTGMCHLLSVDKKALTARVQGGMLWHRLAELLRIDGLDYISAPLNLASSVGGTLGVGGIDVNSARYGCSADQALALQVVTPTGDIVECSDDQNVELFQRVLLGYGQFGIITEATLKIRNYTPMRMHYFFYHSLRAAIDDLMMLDQRGVCDYTGILTLMDKAITLLVGFDTPEREQDFRHIMISRLRGCREKKFALRLLGYYLPRPWRWRQLRFLLRWKQALFPDLLPAHHMQKGVLHDRSAVFSRAVWKHWGHKHMVIPDLAASKEKFITAVERGNAVCKKYFPYYTLYCVGIKLRPEHQPHYELSAIPPDATGWSYGCEFEPILDDERHYSRDYLQSFKNAIYDIGVDMGTSYYRFGGMMKAYIRRALGDAVVDKHLAWKRAADPAMILNRDVIF